MGFLYGSESKKAAKIRRHVAIRRPASADF
jgi:hypothetical protein